MNNEEDCGPCPTAYSVAKVERHGTTKREIHLALRKPSCAPCLAEEQKGLYTEQQVRLDQVLEVLDKNRLNQDLVVFVNYSKERREAFRVHLAKMVSKSGYFFDSVCNLRANFDHRRSCIEVCNPEIPPEIFASILDLLYYKSVISCDDGLSAIRRAAEILDIEEIVRAIDELCRCPREVSAQKGIISHSSSRQQQQNQIGINNSNNSNCCGNRNPRYVPNLGGGVGGMGGGLGSGLGGFGGGDPFCGTRPCQPVEAAACSTILGGDLVNFPVRQEVAVGCKASPCLDDAPLDNPFAALFDAMESGSNQRFHVAYNDVMASFFALSATEEFLKCTLEQVLFILASDLIRVPDEMFVFRAAMRWIYYDQKSRLKHAAEVLENVRFSHMTWKQLQDVKEVELMSQCKQLWEMLSRAFSFHNLGVTRATKLGLVLPRRRRYYGNTANFDAVCLATQDGGGGR